MVWVQLVIAVVLFVVGELLRKPPPDAEPANFEDFGFPDIDPTKRVSVFWGKKRLQSLHNMEVTGFRSRKITQKVNIFGKKATVGFNYYATIAMGICRGPDVTITKIILGDKLLWEGVATPDDDGYTISISDRNFFGKKDGVSGTIRIYPGSGTQSVNNVLQTAHDAVSLPTTAYRGICYAVFEDFWWGTSTTIPQIEIIAERYPDTLGIGADRKINTTPNISPTEGAVDLAIPEIIAEVLTNDSWGLAESIINDVDTADFIAAASTLRAEGNGMSLVWNEGDSIEGLLKTIMQQADGFVYKRMSTGLWEMNLARDEYLAGSPIANGTVLEFDELNSSLIRYSRGNWDETFNVINVSWADRNLKGRPSPATAQDMANFAIQGDRQVANFTFPGCHSPELASFLASRQLRATSFPLATAEITTTRLAHDIVPGDIVSFAWDKLGISRIFMRVSRIALGTPEQGEIRLSLIQDVFGVAATVFANVPTSLAQPQVVDALPVTNALVSDQPVFLGHLDPNNALLNEKPIVLADAPNSNSLQYLIHSKASTDGTYVDQGEEYAFTLNGTLVSDEDPSAGDTVAMVVENVVGASELNGIAQDKGEQQDLGAGMIMIVGSGSPQSGENEICTYDSASVSGSTVTLTNVHRGMADTVPIRAKAGDVVWFMTGDTGTSVDVYGDTDLVNVRLENETTTGVATWDSPPSQFNMQMRRRQDRPLTPQGIDFNSSNISPTTRPDLRYPGNFEFPPGDLLFDWFRRDREVSSLRYQSDADVVPANVNYIVDLDIYAIISGTPSFLRTISANASTATYTKAMQYADGLHPKYMVVLRAYDTAESPRLAALTLVRREFFYNPLLSPLPSPLPTLLTSPFPSPILSPGPSPFSPSIFPSPRSPLSVSSPLPSPVSFKQLMLSLNPQVWYKYQETSGQIINYGSLGTGYNLTASGTPGTYNVRGRNGVARAFAFDGISTDRFTNTSQQFASGPEGTILLAFKIDDKSAAPGDWIFDLYQGFDQDDVALRLSTVGGFPGSPLKASPNTDTSPQSLYLYYFFSDGGVSTDDSVITFPAQSAVLNDGEWHTVVIKKRNGALSPNLPEFYVDGVSIDEGRVIAEGSTSDLTTWLDGFASDAILTIAGRGNPVQNPAPTRMDEWALWHTALTDAEIALLHVVYTNEVIPPTSPFASPASPVPSPLSPVASPISPVPSPISPVPSPFSPSIPVLNSPESPQSVAAGFKGFLISEEPVAYWPLDEGAPDVLGSPGLISPQQTRSLVEEIGGINTFTVGGNVPGAYPITRDNYGHSVSSAGETGDLIEAADAAALDLANTWSIELWFAVGQRNDTTDSQATLLARSASAHELEVAVVDTDVSPNPGSLVVRSTSTASPFFVLYSPFRVDDGLPHYVCLTQDVSGGDAAINLYIDGALAAQTAAIAKPVASANPLYMLGTPSSIGARGHLAHVAIYDKVLSDDSILLHYMEGRRWQPFYGAASKLAPTSWWRTIPEAGTTVKDWTGSIDGTNNDITPRRTGGPLIGQHSEYMEFNQNSPETWLDLGTDPYTKADQNIGGMGCWFRIAPGSPNLSTKALLFITSSTTAEFFGLSINISGVPGLEIRRNTSTNRAIFRAVKDQESPLTSGWTGILTDGEWHHLVIIKRTNAGLPEWYIDGVSYEAVADVLTGTGTATDWIEDMPSSNFRWAIGARVTTAGAVSVTSDKDIADFLFWDNNATLPTALEIAAMYASGIANYPSMTKRIADLRPITLIPVSDKDAVAADAFNNMADGTYNATGTFLNDQLPLAADDVEKAVWFDRSDPQVSYIDFADAFLKEQSDLTSPAGVMPLAFSMLFIAMHERLQGLPTTSANRQMVIANDSTAMSELNFFAEIGGFDNDNIRFDAFPESFKGLESRGGSYPAGSAKLITYLQNAKQRGAIHSPRDDSYRRIFIDDAEVSYSTVKASSPVDGGTNDPSYIEKFVGGLSTQARIGVWEGTTPAADTRNFGGVMSHVAGFDRVLTDVETRKLGFRRRGWQAFPLEVMKYAPSLYWRMDDKAGAREVIDVSGNANHADITGTEVATTLFLDEASQNSNLWHEDVGILRLAGTAASPNDGAWVETPTIPITISTYPYTVGFWGRAADISPANNTISLTFGRTTEESRLSIQVIPGATVTARVTVENAGSQTDGDLTLTSVTPTNWAFYAFVFNAANDVDVYVDGVLKGTITTSIAPTFTPNNLTVGAQVFNGASPATLSSASYHDVFIVDARALSEAEVREIYASAFPPSYDNLVEKLGATAHWKLNEADGAGAYLNAIQDASGHYVVALGEGSPGPSQGADSILPQLPDNSVVFADSGGINTFWKGYPTGNDPWSVSFLMHKGTNASYTSTNVVLGWGDSAGGFNQRVEIQIVSGGDFRINFENGGQSITWSAGTAEDTGMLVCFVYDGTFSGSTDLYIDGILQGSKTNDVGSPSSSPGGLDIVATDNLGIGDRLSGALDLESGRIGRMAFFPSALQLHQVRGLYLTVSGTAVISP